jgi:hypothetical protein
VIELPWLARLIGLACLVLAVFLLHKTWPHKQKRQLEGPVK